MVMVDWHWRAGRGRECSGGHGSCTGSRAGGPLWSPRRTAFRDTKICNRAVMSDVDGHKWQWVGVLITQRWRKTLLKCDRCIHLEEARMEALSPPKQERATAKGIVQFITPNTWSANVWKEKIKWWKAALDAYRAKARWVIEDYVHLPQLQHHCLRWHWWGGLCSKPRWSECRSLSLWAWK